MTSSIYAIEDVVHKNESISSVTLDDPGTNYGNPQVGIDAPISGTQARATAKSKGPVATVSVTERGQNYTSAPDVAITGVGTGATATAFLGGPVTSLILTQQGTAYNSNFNLIFTGGEGSGAAGTAIVNVNSQVESLNLTSGGDGYTSPPFVDFSNGSGINAVATAVTTPDRVFKVTVDNQGSNYESDSTNVVFSGGGGSDAKAFATVQGPVQSPIIVTNGGSGYTSVPNVVIADGSGIGTGATATAVIKVIDVNENILVNDIEITPDMVSPGGGGILRVYFSFEFDGDTSSTIKVLNDSIFKGNFNADNSSLVLDGGYYRFDIDVESGDKINFQSSVAIDSVNFFRTHLVQFGA